MPYIEQSRRKEIDRWLRILEEQDFHVSHGELNYIIQKLAMKMLESGNYLEQSCIIGTIECAKMEFYRRVTANYEDAKMKINGDVFEPPW